MPDRRTVDELSIEELEQVLLMKKRQARMDRLKRYEQQGRRRGDVPMPDDILPAVGTMPAEEPEEEPPPSPKERTFSDYLLLGVEVMAVVGLVVLLIYAVRTVQNINQVAAEEQEATIAALPTPSATPIISAVVLPSGHTPPTDPEGARPNYDEVPAHLRPRVEQQFAGPVTVPTIAPGNATRIMIPAIGVDAPIVLGDGWEQLKKGVGQHLGTANPGESGNMVLSAHNDIFGEIFRRLDALQPGDEIMVETSSSLVFTYVVTGWTQVDPTDVEVMDPTPDPVVTLISCYPYLRNTHRIVVVGRLKGN